MFYRLSNFRSLASHYSRFGLTRFFFAFCFSLSVSGFFEVSIKFLTVLVIYCTISQKIPFGFPFLLCLFFDFLLFFARRAFLSGKNCAFFHLTPLPLPPSLPYVRLSFVDVPLFHSFPGLGGSRGDKETITR